MQAHNLLYDQKSCCWLCILVYLYRYYIHYHHVPITPPHAFYSGATPVGSTRLRLPMMVPLVHSQCVNYVRSLIGLVGPEPSSIWAQCALLVGVGSPSGTWYLFYTASVRIGAVPLYFKLVREQLTYFHWRFYQPTDFTVSSLFSSPIMLPLS